MKHYAQSASLWQLMVIFFKIGSVAFGGGYTIIALLQKELVEKKQWLTTENLIEMTAIVQSLPGVTYINIASMVGYRIAGFRGAMIAVLSGTAPTFILSCCVVLFFWQYMASPLMLKAVNGILIGVSALIAYTIIKMWPRAISNIVDLLLVVTATILLLIFNINPAEVVIGLGLFRSMISVARGGRC